MRRKHEFKDQHGEAITIDFTEPSHLRKLINILKERIF